MFNAITLNPSKERFQIQLNTLVCLGRVPSEIILTHAFDCETDDVVPAVSMTVMGTQKWSKKYKSEREAWEACDVRKATAKAHPLDYLLDEDTVVTIYLNGKPKRGEYNG